MIPVRQVIRDFFISSISVCDSETVASELTKSCCLLFGCFGIWWLLCWEGPCVVRCRICALGLLFLFLYAQAPSRWSLMSYLHYWWWCHPCFDGDWHAHDDTWLPTPPLILFSTPWSRPLWSQCCSAMYGYDGQAGCHLRRSKYMFHYVMLHTLLKWFRNYYA